MVISSESAIDILPLDSADEVSSGEEDKDCQPRNYRFYAERIAHAESMLKQLRAGNLAVETVFAKCGEAVEKAKAETLKQARMTLDLRK